MEKLEKIQRKTLLYKSGVEYADFGLNHVEGCTHGCRYPCYAMMLKKRCGKIASYQDWTQPKIVENSLELLDKEIRSEEHTSELQSHSFISYAVFCLKKKTNSQ